jgi:microcystin degradation protein MlrC
VVVTDDNPELGRRLSEELGEQMWDRRREFLKEITPVGIAVERAFQAEEGPIVLADVADNPGGGAPGDSTFVLKELLRRKARNVGVAVIKDPQAVEEAVKAGVRGVLRTTRWQDRQLPWFAFRGDWNSPDDHGRHLHQ